MIPCILGVLGVLGGKIVLVAGCAFLTVLSFRELVLDNYAGWLLRALGCAIVLGMAASTAALFLAAIAVSAPCG